MIGNDKEYSITRYWRDVFLKPAEIDDSVSPGMVVHIQAGHASMAETLQEEMDEYLQRTGKKDEDFPLYDPPSVAETAVLITG